MQNGSYIKIAIASVIVITLLTIAGAMIPGSPIKPAIDQAAKNIIPGNNPGPTAAIPGMDDPGMFDASRENDYSAILQTIELSHTNDAAASWLSSHKKWELSQANADHMGIQGRSAGWTLTYVDGPDMMHVYMRNGRVIGCNIYTSDASVIHGIKPDGLVDSPIIMKNLMESCPGLIIDEASMPFSFSLKPGQRPYYLIEYGEASTQPGFKMTFDARSGELMESTYRSVSS